VNYKTFSFELIRLYCIVREVSHFLAHSVDTREGDSLDDKLPFNYAMLLYVLPRGRLSSLPSESCFDFLTYPSYCFEKFRDTRSRRQTVHSLGDVVRERERK